MMFKDEFQLDFINVEELGMREEEVDERGIENNIVMKLVPAIFSICLILTASCRQNKTFHSIDSFQGSRVWALAKLVQSEDTVKMSEFVNSNPSIDIDEVDSKYHKNLLIWSIFNGHYKSTEALLRQHIARHGCRTFPYAP